jgi:hypothetical protein
LAETSHLCHQIPFDPALSHFNLLESPDSGPSDGKRITPGSEKKSCRRYGAP